MGRYRASSSGQRSKGKGGGCTLRIAYRQNRIASSGFHNGHTNNLSAACVPAYHGIGKILAVESKNQLPWLCNAYLEKHLISTDVSQIKRRRADACNAPGAVRAILGETDIFSGFNGIGIIFRHQSIKVCIAQYAASRALRTCWACFANGALGADGTSLPYWPLRTGSARCTSGALRPNWACFTGWALRTSGTGWASSAGFSRRTLGANGARLSGRALGSDRASHTGRALHPGRTSHTGRTLRPNWALLTGRALGANRALYACWALGSGRTCNTGGALGPNSTGLPYRALRAYGAGDSSGALHPGRASGSRNTLGAHRASGPYRPLGSGRTCIAIAGGVIAAAIILGVIPLAAIAIVPASVVLILEAFVSTHSIPSLLDV